MATVTKYGYTATAKRIIGTTATAFSSMALGSGSQADSTDLQSLQSEIAASGLARASAATADVVSSATASDTCRFVHTWTATASLASGVKECGVLNSATTGDMLAYGTFASAIPMESGDTLQVTWSVQVKAGA